MLTIGFSTQYYTLWEVGEPQKRYTSGATVNGVFTGSYYMEQKCTYMQNLSKDYDIAVAKIEELSGGIYGIDLDLRGHSTFVRNCGNEGNDMPDHVFTFGKLIGQDIREAVDVWQLNRATKEEKGKRRRAIARRRLIDLGELVRNTSGIGEERYISPSHLKFLKDQAFEQNANGHHFQNGKRITITVERIGGTSYETRYGVVFIEKYLTEDGKLLKYKGSSPLPAEYDNAGFIMITGTVEHVMRDEQPETRLKRIKLATKKAA